MSFYQLNFHSDILEKDTDILIALPKIRNSNTKTVYLLHGGGGGNNVDNKSFLPQKERLEKWAEKFNTVFIMPSAPDSFFANTHTGIMYQDYLLKELVPEITELLKLSDKRIDAAVCGMSMGGTSSFRLGMAASEIFGTIGCLSSGNLWMTPLSNRVHSYAVKNVFGVEKIEDIEGTQYDFFVDVKRNVLENKPLPHIFHACGKEDHAYEHAHLTSIWLKENAKEYDYNYFEPEIGKHDDDFFNIWMQKFLEFFTNLK